MKQLTTSMDILERNHYEKKIKQLDELIAQFQQSGDPITMDQLMERVGLSTRLKEPKVSVNTTNPDENKGGLEGGQTFKSRRQTERKIVDSGAMPYLMSPVSNLDIDLRNHKTSGSQTADGSSQSNDKSHLKLLKRLQDEKNARVGREAKR